MFLPSHSVDTFNSVGRFGKPSDPNVRALRVYRESVLHHVVSLLLIHLILQESEALTYVLHFRVASLELLLAMLKLRIISETLSFIVLYGLIATVLLGNVV